MISEYLMEDLKKYYPDFQYRDFENMSEEYFIQFARKYYRDHLPVDISTWIRVNHAEEKLIFKDSLIKQVCFMRDRIAQDLFLEPEYKQLKRLKKIHSGDSEIFEKEFQPMVIGTHRSKSVLLPVTEINLKSVGVKIVMRNNIYDWCVSIESEKEIHCDFKGLITSEKGYFEGFPTNRVYDNYSEKNRKNFSFCIQGYYELYTLLFLLKDYLYNEKSVHKNT